MSDGYDPEVDSLRSYEVAISELRARARSPARLEPGDCLEVVPRLVAEGVLVDAIVCDPPYHLTATVKRFSSERLDGNTDIARRARKERAGQALDGHARMAAGFMGQRWDGGDIAFRPETWATMAAILRPGGFLLAFGGTRTWHRMVCAIEDAGFVIQDTIMWLYGSGFPKRRDMLKPAFEPICVTYKPGGKRTLQVDECRIPTDGETITAGHADSIRRGNLHEQEGWDRPWKRNTEDYASRREAALDRANNLGRWPANVVHDGSDEVMEALAAFGNAPGSLGVVNGCEASNPTSNVYGAFKRQPSKLPRGDTGTAARFFYCAKADAQDRWGSRHPTVKPVELMKWLVQLVCPKGGLVLDPFAGSGTTGVAALATGRKAILIEREEQYQADIRERLAHYEGTGRHSVVAKNRQQRADAGALRDGGRLEDATDKRIGTLPLFGTAQ